MLVATQVLCLKLSNVLADILLKRICKEVNMMYEKNLNLVASESEKIVISKDERYELIAQIVERLNEYNESPNVEVKQLWDCNDTQLNFDEIVNYYNC